ncbi:MAG: hypothetical protein DLM50_02770 [Candidatus Meridianibacter frigidus]|nr:MAG: hypothetical protein DLM50_02770 [Candidatus Eremiobacteraeota bacterium]
MNSASRGELTPYLRSLPGVQLIIVDGSPAEIFAAHNRSWSAFAVHVPPDHDIQGKNGKVRGVLTGLRRAEHSKVIVADDDVRYDARSLGRVLDALDHAEVVRPQNYFQPHTWHTILDSSRTLLNRMWGGDWPGTLGLRKTALPKGYNADVLFENLELVRTVAARGGREMVLGDVFVARRPPSVRHFWRQRVRQAYDEFARPARLALALAILPALCGALLRRNYAIIAAGAALTSVLAETGRRRQGAAAYFPAAASLAAPFWLLERGLSAWAALGLRLTRGGVPYAGSVIAHAATPMRELRTQP